MKLVIPMSGYGSRFSVEGYKLPKPLIDVKGKPMVWWALKSLPEVPASDLIFIVNEKHIKENDIDKVLKETFGYSIKIIIENTEPTGQATTVLLAHMEINNDNPLVIYNCDTYAPTAKTRLLNAIQKFPECDGFVPVFNSSAPNLSYVKTDASGIVTEVAEKRVISSDATIGLYHFKKGSDFVDAATEMKKKEIKVNNEYYVLPAYQFLINKGKKIMKLAIDQIHVLGTPIELNEFLKR